MNAGFLRPLFLGGGGRATARLSANMFRDESGSVLIEFSILAPAHPVVGGRPTILPDPPKPRYPSGGGEPGGADAGGWPHQFNRLFRYDQSSHGGRGVARREHDGHSVHLQRQRRVVFGLQHERRLRNLVNVGARRRRSSVRNLPMRPDYLPFQLRAGLHRVGDRKSPDRVSEEGTDR